MNETTYVAYIRTSDDQMTVAGKLKAALGGSKVVINEASMFNPISRSVFPDIAEGHYMVCIRPGSISWFRVVENPALPEVEAALAGMKDEISHIIYEAQGARLPAPLSDREKKAWNTFRKNMGLPKNSGLPTLTVESTYETTCKVIDAIRRKIKSFKK